MAVPSGAYDTSAVSAADAAVAAAINATLGGRDTRRAVMVSAPAGAGNPTAGPGSPLGDGRPR
jgi:hypothetical protein